jgi:hypothetical protein
MEKYYIIICIFTKKLSYMINLIPLNSSESKEFIDTKIAKIGQDWDELWPLSHGWPKPKLPAQNFFTHQLEFKKLQLDI